MIALADTMRTTSLRLVGAWNAFATRYNPFALIAVACAVLTGPLIFFRGYNSDEGLAVSIARTALEDGEWLVPHVFNISLRRTFATPRNHAQPCRKSLTLRIDWRFMASRGVAALRRSCVVPALPLHPRCPAEVP